MEKVVFFCLRVMTRLKDDMAIKKCYEKEKPLPLFDTQVDKNKKN